jgi:hypothetical protein
MQSSDWLELRPYAKCASAADQKSQDEYSIEYCIDWLTDYVFRHGEGQRDQSFVRSARINASTETHLRGRVAWWKRKHSKIIGTKIFNEIHEFPAVVLARIKSFL